MCQQMARYGNRIIESLYRFIDRESERRFQGIPMCQTSRFSIPCPLSVIPSVDVYSQKAVSPQTACARDQNVSRTVSRPGGVVSVSPHVHESEDGQQDDRHGRDGHVDRHVAAVVPSSVAKFDPDDIVDKDEVGVKIKTLIVRMNALKACLETDLFDIAPLDSIKVLWKNFDRALCDAYALLRYPPDKREEYCEHLNDVWNEEVNNVIYCDLYFIGPIIPFHTEDYPVYDCFPEFMVIPAPTQRMAKEKLQKTASETVDHGMDSYTNAFGPYENESECKDIVSYLKIKWMIDVGAPADHNTVALVKNMVNEYNIITGE